MSTISDYVIKLLEDQLGDGVQKTQRKPSKKTVETRLRKGKKVFVIRCTASLPRMQVVEVCFKGKKLIVSKVPYLASPRARIQGQDELMTVEDGVEMFVGK